MYRTQIPDEVKDTAVRLTRKQLLGEALSLWQATVATGQRVLACFPTVPVP